MCPGGAEQRFLDLESEEIVAKPLEGRAPALVGQARTILPNIYTRPSQSRDFMLLALHKG